MPGHFNNHDSEDGVFDRTMTCYSQGDAVRTSTRKSWRYAVAAVAVVAAFVTSVSWAFADEDVFSPESRPFDKPFKEWSAEWWQFVLSIPTTVNPLADQSGQDCMVGQHGPVWFLVGTFGQPTAVRICSIPAGKALFFPIVNSVNLDTRNACGQGPEPLLVRDLRAASAAFADGATNLAVDIDGERIKQLQHRFRVRSAVFELTVPADNLFNPFCPNGLPARTYFPAVDDGFYVMLKPLEVGTHTLHLHGEVPSQGFSVDVTYYLNIVPLSLR